MGEFCTVTPCERFLLRACADRCHFFRRLQSLRLVRHHGTHVSLQALACIAPQLRCLDLEGCRIEAESNPTHFFSLLGKLEDLNLRDGSIDASFGRVACPCLKKLVVDDLAVKEAEPAAHFIDGFNSNSAALTHLALSVDDPAQMIHADGFASLEVIRLALHLSDHEDEELEWPGLCPQICLLSSLSTLACKTAAYPVEEIHSIDEEVAIDLYTMLALCRSSIGAGVGIKELRCAHCATFVDVLHNEPEEEDFEAVYRPACRALHGLTKLDLRNSPLCSQETIDEVVQHAPDLAWLGMGQKCGPAEWQRTRPVLCRNLKELAVLCSAWGQGHGGGQLAFELILNDSAALESCEVHIEIFGDLEQGNSVVLHLETWDHAGISASACLHEVRATNALGGHHCRTRTGC
jgi:hypothetical protein